jgi:hypothetical protein
MPTPSTVRDTAQGPITIGTLKLVQPTVSIGYEAKNDAVTRN